MHIGVYGSGYLGTVLSACLADFGTPVTCCDENAARLNSLAQGNIPFFEKNLQDVVRRNLRAGRLIYSTDLASFAAKSQAIFMAEDSHHYIEEVALKLARMAARNAFLILVTPVPVGTAGRIEKKLKDAGVPMVVVSHPVFVTDGCAVEDFNWPDRIVLGTDSTQAVTMVKQIYRPLAMRGVPVIVTNHETAELVREASTAFCATKISFINEIAGLCEHVGADAVDLSLALGLDKKIAPRCLQPGAGFGGPFVEHDMDSLAQLATGKGIALKILAAAREVNVSLSDRVVHKLHAMMESVMGKEVGILGLAFKPNTNSVAASSSILLARRLLAQGAHVRAYDPVALPTAKMELNGSVRYCENAYQTAEGAEALVVGTGWPEFRALDFDKIKRLLKRPVLVDTKNLLDGPRMKAMGFQYAGVGRR
ncbi:MAG TPA: nucleotide sugar dehydrogenase [Terriglobales bacterium]|nr:nucleotide sugar dehydrogenase [Terriglobales bacterium]